MSVYYGSQSIILAYSEEEAGKSGVYRFKVKKQASKSQIKKIVELMFGKEVNSVNTMNYKGKARKFKGIYGIEKSYKKCIVRLSDSSASII